MGFYIANFNTGGRYNPGTDNWTATSTVNAPLAENITRQCGLARNDHLGWTLLSKRLFEHRREILRAIRSAHADAYTGPITLSAAGRKVGGINTVRLTWSGATSTNIDVYRNGAPIVTTANDGAYTDSTGDTGRARYTYRVCEAGTPTCSNDARVSFPQ